MRNMQLMLTPDQTKLIIRIIEETDRGHLWPDERKAANEFATYLRWRYARLWGQMTLFRPPPNLADIAAHGTSESGETARQAPRDAPATVAADPSETVHGSGHTAAAMRAAHEAQTRAIERINRAGK